jgi:hypothetical protein
MNEGVVMVVDVPVLGVQVLACQVPATKVKSKIENLESFC